VAQFHWMSTSREPQTRCPNIRDVNPTATVAASRAVFRSRDLDRMCSGTVELSVPLQGDVIPIGQGGPMAVGRIVVAKRRRTVQIRRLDGQPIQVAIITDVDESTTDGPVHHTLRRHVFRHPVDEVVLVRIRDPAGHGQWYAATNAFTPAGRAHIKRFADTIGVFASAKQRAVR
jgi:hypothetical protein